ncbi:MAG: hypothetical protein WBV27_10620, partial [Trichococcus sp.]|uniref:hypothetical protein n=1 Tax=Trichococcus sp. TaxID=1985464 RepID=UPI003C380682
MLMNVLLSVDWIEDYLFIYHDPMAAIMCMDYYTQSCGGIAIRMLRMEVSAVCDTVLGIRPARKDVVSSERSVGGAERVSAVRRTSGCVQPTLLGSVGC